MVHYPRQAVVWQPQTGPGGDPPASGRKGMREYRCAAHAGRALWHVGHLPAAVLAGRSGVRDVYGRDAHPNG